MIHKFGFTLVIIIAAGFLSCESQLPPRPRPPQYHGFMFVLQWPPTFCKQIRCAQTLERFTIRGLWPFPHGTAGRSQLTDAVLTNHTRDLLRYWPDLTTTSLEQSKTFWRSEYENYGVYCASEFSPDAYFTKAIELGKVYNIMRVYLESKNIRPNNNKDYAASAIIDAVKELTGYRPNLKCVTLNRRCYLLQVRICYNPAATEHFNCPQNSGGCQSRIYYPQSVTAFDEVPEIAENVTKIIEVM